MRPEFSASVVSEDVCTRGFLFAQAASGRAFDFLDYLPTPACVDDADDFRRAVELWCAALEKDALRSSGVSGVTLSTARLQAHAVAVLSQRGDLGQAVQFLGMKTASSIGLRKKAPPRGALYNPLLWGARHYHAPGVAMDTLAAAKAKGAFLPTDTWNMILGAVCPCGRPDDIAAVLLAMDASATAGNLETIKHLTTARSVRAADSDSKPQRVKAVADARSTLLRLLTLWAPAFTEMDAGAAGLGLAPKESFTRERMRGGIGSSGIDTPVSGDRKPSSSARPRMSATTRQVVRAGSISSPTAKHHHSAAAHSAAATPASSGLGLTINLGGGSGMTAQALADALVSSLASVQQAQNTEHAGELHIQQHAAAVSAGMSPHDSQYVSLSGLGGLGSSTSSGLGLGVESTAPVWGDSLGLAGSSNGWASLTGDSSSHHTAQGAVLSPEEEASETAAATAAAVWGGDGAWGGAPSEPTGHHEHPHRREHDSSAPHSAFTSASAPWGDVTASRHHSMSSAVSASSAGSGPAGTGSALSGGSGVDPAILQRAQLALEALMAQEHGGGAGGAPRSSVTSTGSAGSVPTAAAWGTPQAGFAPQPSMPGGYGATHDPMQVLQELRAPLVIVGTPQGYHPHHHPQHVGVTGGPHPTSAYTTPYMQSQVAPPFGTPHQPPPAVPHPHPAHYTSPSQAYPVGGGSVQPFHGAHHTPPAHPSGASPGQWDGARSDVSRGSRGSGSGVAHARPASNTGSVSHRERQNTRGSVLSGASRTSKASRSSNANDSAVSGRSGSSRGSGHNSPRKLSRKQIGLLPTPPVAPSMMPGGTNPMLTPARSRLAPTYGRQHQPQHMHMQQQQQQHASGGAHQGGYDPPSSYHVTPPARTSFHSMMSSDHSSARTVRTGSTSTSRNSFVGGLPGQGGYPQAAPAQHGAAYAAGLYSAGVQQPGHYQ